jgi:peptidyl-prolyl cis-trans isomerase SurA
VNAVKLIAALFVLLGFAYSAPANAQEALVIATVNDQPVTTFDIEQRIRLLTALGQPPGTLNRKKIANDVINDYVKMAEAKHLRMEASAGEVDSRLKSVAASMKTDLPGLPIKLKKLGIGMSTLRNYVVAQMAFGRILNVHYKEKVEVDPNAVDKKFAEVKAEMNGKLAKIMADPRMQPVSVYTLLEINFPVEGNDPQLLQSRAIEASQYLQKFKSCANPRGPASGIFNVQIGKKIEADSRKLPPPMKKLFDSKGPGHAFGPMRGPRGVQVMAFCSTRKIVPPKPNVQYPTRKQIENAVLNDTYGRVEDKYLAIMRKNSVIEYKDQSYAE